jgi:hypothetical protein
MKRILAYSGHLLAATLAVPWLTMLAGGVTYGIFSPFLASTSSLQQFFSDHLIFLAVVVGATLAYSVSGTFTSKSALWVWIPAATVFVLRALHWRANGSALFGSGSFVEHFFTASCQIQNWREGGFESRCFDRLYVTQLFAGSLAFGRGCDSSRHPLLASIQTRTYDNGWGCARSASNSYHSRRRLSGSVVSG